VENKFAILIVDDDAGLTSNLQDIMEAEDYNVMVAHDGQTALSLHDKSVFDLALVDIRLPDISGMELIKKLIELSPGITFIIITGYASMDTAVEAAGQRDIAGYVTKPLAIDNLLYLVRQVVKRKEAEKALYKRQQEFITLVENASDIIARFDKEFRHVYINPAVERETGMLPEVFIGKTNQELGTPEDLVAKWHEAIKSVFETGQERTVDTEYATPTGIKYYSNRLAPEFAEDGSVATVLNISRDITERNKAEEALKLSSTQWQNTFDAVNDATCVLNAEGKIQRCNDAMSQLISKPLSDMIGHTCCEFIHGSPKHLEGCPWVSMQNSKSRERAELSVGDKWFEITVDPILDSDHKLVGAVHVLSDITERKRLGCP